jgi:Fe-S-cluster-containing dehydrogenase component/formate-dependent nitrite reductase membrane component NrfD
MNYGFLIDNRKCIGCHACSTACKSENEVPLGVYRTWVKYTQKGEFPDVRRSFQVTRCNHCANPPCVRICPVTAMYQRTDGIVEFDPRICIGCKACMQACPYDAIYIDPETHTAAKCHYCSHRVEVGLEPACVVVCPEHAIIAGDLNDPSSEISQLIAREQVTVRKPEQGTAPKLFYIEGDQISLTPTASPMTGSYAFADLITEQEIPVWGESHAYSGNGGETAVKTATAHSGVAIRIPSEQGLGREQGPIMIGEGTMAEHMVQTAYNAQHKVPWHWPVPAYLVTKAIGSGAFALMALFFGFGLAQFNPRFALAGNFISLLFIGITTGLLVYDLDRPARFFSILTRPQWKSWLTRGAFILISFTAVAGSWFLLEGSIELGWLQFNPPGWLRLLILAVGFVLAILSAIYTAFLFGQAEGRDLWQSSLLPFHLVVQAFMAGSAALLLLAIYMGPPPGFAAAVLAMFGIALILDLFITLVGEFSMPHASELAARAAHQISHGKYRLHFWVGAILVGHVLPLALLISGFFVPFNQPVLVITAAAALVGLFYYEYAFVMAPQEIPNS